MSSATGNASGDEVAAKKRSKPTKAEIEARMLRARERLLAENRNNDKSTGASGSSDGSGASSSSKKQSSSSKKPSSSSGGDESVRLTGFSSSSPSSPSSSSSSSSASVPSGPMSAPPSSSDHSREPPSSAISPFDTRSNAMRSKVSSHDAKYRSTAAPSSSVSSGSSSGAPASRHAYPPATSSSSSQMPTSSRVAPAGASIRSVAPKSSSSSSSSSSSAKSAHRARPLSELTVNWTLVDDSEPEEVLRVKHEYDQVERLMEKWELRNHYKPFNRNVVLLLGSSSSGKSSFVNNFFGVTVKRTASFQMDTVFTLVETIPESDFAKLVPDYRRREFPVSELQAPIADEYADRRRNTVYIALDTISTLARHPQLESFGDVFRHNDLVRCVLVNSAYLNCDEMHKRTLESTILVDSPGFTGEISTSQAIGNLHVLQYMYHLSDMTLFFISSDSIGMMDVQVRMFELSLLYAFQGRDKVDKALKEGLDKSSKSSGGMFQLGDVVNVLSNVVAGFSLPLSFLGGSEDEAHVRGAKAKSSGSFQGAVSWNKVRFVLTKMDLMTRRESENESRGVAAQFFELGSLLGRSLRYLRTPVFDQCFAIALADPQRARSPNAPPHNSYDLERLHNLVGSLNFYESYVGRLEAAIQRMCDELLEHIQKSWWAWAPHMNKSVDDIKEFARRSRQRSNLAWREDK